MIVPPLITTTAATPQDSPNGCGRQDAAKVSASDQLLQPPDVYLHSTNSNKKEFDPFIKTKASLRDFKSVKENDITTLEEGIYYQLAAHK